MDEMRAYLDSLMGADRNALPEKRQNRQQRFNDPDVCKYFLIDFCPHDLFPNTRSDLGPCGKIHNEALREQYKNSEDHGKFAPIYESEFIVFLEKLIESAEQKIEKANRRIDAPLPDSALLSEEQQKQVDKLNEEISKLLTEAEKAGERGDVEEAAVLTRQVGQLRKEAERAASSLYGSYMQREKSLRVCPICGAMQSVGDSMSRFESHVTGKQHQGFEKIRSCLEELQRRKAEREKCNPLATQGFSSSSVGGSSSSPQMGEQQSSASAGGCGGGSSSHSSSRYFRSSYDSQRSSRGPAGRRSPPENGDYYRSNRHQGGGSGGVKRYRGDDSRRHSERAYDNSSGTTCSRRSSSWRHQPPPSSAHIESSNYSSSSPVRSYSPSPSRRWRHEDSRGWSAESTAEAIGRGSSRRRRLEETTNGAPHSSNYQSSQRRSTTSSYHRSSHQSHRSHSAASPARHQDAAADDGEPEEGEYTNEEQAAAATFHNDAPSKRQQLPSEVTND